MRHLLLPTVLCLLAGSASADVVDPEPESCPPGSTPSTAHSGPYCALSAECSTDADCASGTCDAVMQCIETRACGGLMPPDAAPCTLEHVVGPCADDGTCATGTCRARSVCGGGSGGSDGCGCSAVGAGSGSGAVWIGVVLGLVVVWRRRR